MDIEQVWDWAAPAGLQWAKLTNSNAAGRGPLSMKIEWDGNQLPHFMQWRNACEAMYVQGLEPSTTGLKGRENDDSHKGPAPMVQPGKNRQFAGRWRRIVAFGTDDFRYCWPAKPAKLDRSGTSARIY